MTRKPVSSRLKKFWKERVMALIVAQLKQGIAPQKIALTIALGLNLGIFPIVGATSLLCALAGFSLKLNQPVIQLINWLVSPLQLALIVVFVRIGEWVTRASPVSFSVPELFRKFHESPSRFFQEFGMTGVHGIIAWTLLAPVVATLLYFILLPAMKKLARLHK